MKSYYPCLLYTSLRDELVNRLGAERCRVVAYGPDCKDANEHLEMCIRDRRISVKKRNFIAIINTF